MATTNNQMSGNGSADPYNPNGLVGKLGTKLENSLKDGPYVQSQSSYVPISGTTQSGINSITSAANQPNGLGAAQSWNTGLIGSGGLTDAMRGNIGTVGGIGSQFGALASSLSGPSAAQTGYTSLYDKAGDPSLTESNLMGTANGNYLNGANPYFEDVLGRSINDVSTGAQAAYGATGRYGSNVAAEGIGNAIGDVSSKARMQQYETERDRQVQALSAIEQQRQQGFTNQFNSLGASDAARLSQIGAQSGALTNQLGAASTGFGMGQQGISNAATAAGNAGQLFQNTLMPGQALTAAGTLQDANANAQRAAELQLAEQNHNAKRDNALTYLQGIGGVGAQQPAEVPWYLQALGLGGQLAGSALSGGLFG